MYHYPTPGQLSAQLAPNLAAGFQVGASGLALPSAQPRQFSGYTAGGQSFGVQPVAFPVGPGGMPASPQALFPIGGSARARNDLADAFEEFDLEANMMKLVGLDVLPLLDVSLAHGTYPNIPIKELMRRPLSEEATPAGNAYRRAPNGGYIEDDFGFTEASYTTQEHGLVGRVDRNQAAHYRSHFDHELAVTTWIRHRLMVQHELRVATAAFDTTRFTGSQTHAAGNVSNPGPGGATPWSTHASADPVADVFHAKRGVWDTFGVMPDTMVINELAFQHLRLVDDIQTRLLASGMPGETPSIQPRITAAKLAEVLDLDEVIVAGAAEDANNANAATFAAQYIWGASALVFKKARRSTIDEVALGHTLHWGEDDSMPNGFVETFFDDDTRCWKVRVRHQTREFIKYNVGYLITSVYS